MLFTRCPHCNTTFRITTEALGKAGGQVRCGRCVNIFDAHAELREQAEEAPEAAGPDAQTAGASAAATAQATAPASDAAPATATAPAAPDGGAASPAEAENAQVRDDDEPVGETIVLGGDDDPPTSIRPAPAMWSLEDDPEEEQAPARKMLWRGAAFTAAIVLLLQVTHHFRAEFAGQPIVGPIVRNAYALLGAPVTPLWDVKQYQVLDWVATAEPDENGRDVLTITARIQNRGPGAQPYPHVHIQLKDRWEDAIGSRVFAPGQYVANHNGNSLMAAGDTAQAQLTVADPGPDAYGFEIDVCVQRDAQQLLCANDQVFR